MKILYITLFFLLSLITSTLGAQRLAHASIGNGGGMSRTGASHSINGGVNKSFTRPTTNKINQVQKQGTHVVPKRPIVNKDHYKELSARKPIENKVHNPREFNSDRIKNNINTIHRTNVNVNINVHVNHSNIYYNGYRGYYPHYYHPFIPYYYGYYWHPWGYFITSMVATAIIISFNNEQYYYDRGVYYLPYNNGYTVVNPPTNIVVQTLPKDVETITLNGKKYYYFGGAFYEKSSNSYRVIPAPDGAVIAHIPDGAEEIDVDGEKYVVYNETYYMPIIQNGKYLYQVVSMISEE